MNDGRLDRSETKIRTNARLANVSLSQIFMSGEFRFGTSRKTMSIVSGCFLIFRFQCAGQNDPAFVEMLTSKTKKVIFVSYIPATRVI